jgi:hypothetical protein
MEVVTVYPDGSADLVAIMEGDPADIHDGDALPTDDTGWKTREETQKDKDGKETLARFATMHLDAGKQPPASYAKPGTPLADVALVMPAEIAVEKRDDGTYYHFRRTYKAREWARTGYWRHKLLESDEMNALGKKEPSEITPEERQKMAHAFIDYERRRQLVFLDEAADMMQPHIPQDIWLQTRNAAVKTYDAEPVIERAAALFVKEGGEVDATALEKELKGKLRESLTKELESRKVAGSAVERLLAAYDKVQLNYAITEDIGDDAWAVQVLLPGKIVGHDATEEPVAIGPQNPWGADVPAELQAVLKSIEGTKVAAGYQTVKWEFDGEALWDRDVTVRASSFVPKQ